mgnify:CR=1 FL=1
MAKQKAKRLLMLGISYIIKLMKVIKNAAKNNDQLNANFMIYIPMVPCQHWTKSDLE